MIRLKARLERIFSHKRLTIALVYSPIALMVIQLLANLMYFLMPTLYASFYDVIANYAGSGVLFTVPLLFLVYCRAFCSVSRLAAWSLFFNSLLYTMIGKWEFWNNTIQIISSIVAFILTIYFYTEKFPRCTLAGLRRLAHNFIKTHSCTQAFNDLKDEHKDLLRTKKRAHNGRYKMG